MRKLSEFILRQGGLVLALVLALNLSPVGLAVAAGTIGSLDIVNGGVKTVDLGKSAVTKAKLAKNSVNSAKIADGAVTGADIANGSVTGADIANGAVDSARILDGQIADADIAAGAAIAASKINRAGLNADLLDGVDSAALVKNNTAADQTLAGKLSAPNFAYSSAKTGSLTISPISSHIVGDYQIQYGASINASGTTPVDWYAPVYLPNGATITSFSHTVVTDGDALTTAELHKWTATIASVTSPNHGVPGLGGWGDDSTTTITAPTYDENTPYYVHVHLSGSHDSDLQSAYVKINYTYTSPGN